MSIRVAQIPLTDLMVEFVEHHGMVNLCRRGSTETFTMTGAEYREMCMSMPRLRAQAQACASAADYDRMSPRPIIKPRRIAPNGAEL